MKSNITDYDSITLIAEKRIVAHVKAALRKQPLGETKERAFFVASANEALFMWMALASRMHHDRFPADRLRLMSMVEDVISENALTSHNDANAEASPEGQRVTKCLDDRAGSTSLADHPQE